MVVSLARVPPGKESFVYHSHERDEEFLFIISGRGRAEIDDEVFEVGPGDFMGFQAPGVAHHLTNPYDEDLVYLMGGERSGLDVGYFPRLKRRIVFGKTGIHAVSEDHVRTMHSDEWFVGQSPSAPDPAPAT
ncbi:MAG TPA: cupin domain-containing protein [Microvirga sp.]